MALQPASGARDLLPQDVGANRWICEQLAEVYRRWGYDEVMPPSIERLDTLEAGGAIEPSNVLQVVADEALGLRPEMTASIARAACTRLSSLQRPLRLHYSGSIFLAERREGENPRVSEQLQSGVELMGASASAGDAELLRLLLDAAGHLPLSPEQQPTLLIGHQGLLALVLEGLPSELQRPCRQALCNLDRLGLRELPLNPAQRERLEKVLNLRGEPAWVLEQLEALVGPSGLFASLQGLVASVAQQAQGQGIRLQLDPSFQPQFALYDGLVLKLVCQGEFAPVAIASGGRYDRLVQRFSPNDPGASGVGFGFAVEEVRQLLEVNAGLPPGGGGSEHLVAFARADQLNGALDRLQEHHRQGLRAELWPDPCASRAEAEQIAQRRGIASLDWLG